jgi:glycosyltransferase involved in cell wall biosynthesis
MAADLRIAFVSPAWPAGLVQNGIATYVGYLREGLAALGVRAAVISREVGAGADDLVVATDEREHSLGRRLSAALVRRFAKRRAIPVLAARSLADATKALAARWPFHVLEMEESFGTAGLLRRHCRAPIVVRLHGPWFLTGAASGVPNDATFRARVRMERDAIVRAAAVSVPTHALLRAVREHCGHELPRAHVVPNPGPTFRTDVAWRPRRDRRQLLHVGRFERLKGSDVAIDAFARLAPAHPDLELLLVGPDMGMRGADGSLQTFAQFLARRALPPAIAARIRFLGALPPAQVDELRRAATAALVVSRYENFPMTVLEAMADGCPLVATRVGGIPEMLEDGVTGRLVAPGDPDALASALRELLANPDAAAALGNAARAHYRDHFAPPAVARSMLALYGRVAGVAGSG